MNDKPCPQCHGDGEIQVAGGQTDTCSICEGGGRMSSVKCQCAKCTGCAPPPPPEPDECEPDPDDLAPVFCHRCGRYPQNDCGTERIKCGTTGDWLCEVCSNVMSPYCH